MQILVRHGLPSWQAVESVRFENEDALQALLKDSPEIIPSDPSGDAVRTVWCREYPTAAGPIDVLGVGSDGSVTIVECKLIRNQDRRKVVAQVLDYASALWGVDVDEFCSTYETIGGFDPIASLGDLAARDAIEFDHGAVRATLAECLADGAFRLMIAVDSLDDGLRRVITYINSRGTGGQRLKVVALTFPMYRQGDIEILVPESFGDESPSPVSPTGARGRREWTESEFLDALGSLTSPTAHDLALDLIDWMRRNGTSPTFGRGATGPLYVHIPLGPGGDTVRAFDLSSSDQGRLEVLFNHLAKVAPFDRAVTRHVLKRRLNAIPGVAVADTTAEEANWTNFTVAHVADPGARQALMLVLDWITDEVRRADRATHG